MIKTKRIGVLTPGGDAPGMNAAVRAVTYAASNHGVEVMGVLRGYSGLMDGDVKRLDLHDVENIICNGGTILYSDRCPAFKTEDGMQRAVATCRAHSLDGIVVIGGDGSLRGAGDLSARGIPCIVLPCTINNDIVSTDNAIGFDTAMNTVIEMADRLRVSCESHACCNVVEVMGRDAGDIAVQTGVATGAVGVAIPEVPFDYPALIRKIKKERAAGKRNFIVIVSEGMGSTFSQKLVGDIQKDIGEVTRFARLAHVIRGGRPGLRDRLLASRFGEVAVNSFCEGKVNLVVGECNGEIVTTDINRALALNEMYKHHFDRADGYTSEQATEMKAYCRRKTALIRALYETCHRLSM